MNRSNLTIQEGIFLVHLAREAISKFLEGIEIKPPPETLESLKDKSGVFVTLNKNGESKELRGCIGYPYPTDPLVVAVINSAIEAATRDPRFPPLSLSELKEIMIEVSVLTKPELIKVKNNLEYPEKISIGLDGLIVEKGYNKGLLLPQVPGEWNWNEGEFLANCCMKAGLSPDSWLLKGINIYKFQAVVFEEEIPGGEIHIKKLQ